MHCDNGRVEKRDAFFPYEDRIGRAGGSRGVTETIQQRSQASTRCSAPRGLVILVTSCRSRVVGVIGQ